VPVLNRGDSLAKFEVVSHVILIVKKNKEMWQSYVIKFRNVRMQDAITLGLMMFTIGLRGDDDAEDVHTGRMMTAN
jgi:hypothetical protein